MAKYSKIIRNQRELEPGSFLPYKSRAMASHGAQCKCGKCDCCRIFMLVCRILSLDHSRSVNK